MEQQFVIGDFVRLKELQKFINIRVNKKINIFEIKDIGNEYIRLDNIEPIVPLFAIEPIPINGIDDKEIYYDPIIMASFVRSGDPVPAYTRDDSYYVDSFSRTIYKERTLKEMIEEKQFKYVHEVQHFLKNELKDVLKIDVF